MQLVESTNVRWIAATLGALLAVSGCASGPSSSAKGTWDGARPTQPFAKVLVVGLTPNLNSRCAFERSLVEELSGGSTTVVASCAVTDHKAPLDRALVEKAVAAQSVDAVLVTKLIAKDWARQDGGSRDTRGSAGYKATDAGMVDAYGYYGGVYSVPVVYGEYHANAESIVLQGEAQVESTFWSVAGPTMVYSLQTRVRGVESSDEGRSLVASTIARDLARQKLVH